MKRKVLFLDRDGTLIIEPPDTYQVDSLEKLEFYPKVIRNLYQIASRLNYELVMVSNQDGLGSEQYPRETFDAVQKLVLSTFRNEGIHFQNILIDPSKPEDNSPNRKPRTGMLRHYLEGNYDLANSFVIGDRITDIELAHNLGANGILLSEDHKVKKEISHKNFKETCKFISSDWDAVTRYLFSVHRQAKVSRRTGETDVLVILQIDGEGKANINTGIGFYDHMLEQIARHSGINLTIEAKGDIHVDKHHTIEDTALVLGEAFYKALGNKMGIERYGFVLPMDDSLATVAIDFGGRPWLEWDAEFKRERIGEMPAEMFFHLFKSFTDTAKCNLFVRAEGSNEHHKIESIFKAFAKAIKMAVRQDPFQYKLPSTKGVL